MAVPIYQTVAHDFIDAEHAGAVLDLEVPGFHYNRINNPTNDVLEQRIAALEGGTAALVVASGMAAVSYAILTVAIAGSNMVVAPQLYGATFTYFAHVLPTLGHRGPIRPRRPGRVDRRARSTTGPAPSSARPSAIRPATSSTSRRWRPSPTTAGVPLIVDNTVATPLLLKPIRHGADVVVHSLTKFVGGHGTTLGGAIVDGGTFPWTEHAERFPMFNQPEPAFHGVVFARDFPERPFTVRARSVQLRNTGATLSPLAAFQLLQGLETMAVRLERHEVQCPGRRRVPGRRSPGGVGELRRLPRPPLAPTGPALSARARALHHHLRGGGRLRAGLAFFDSLQLFKRLLNLGDAKSLAIHPASTTHRQLSDGGA